MLFDTHAHMDDRAFDADREGLLEALPEKGVGLLMNPGCSLESSRNACALAGRYDYIYAAVGSHPDAADEVNVCGGIRDGFRCFLKNDGTMKIFPSSIS